MRVDVQSRIFDYIARMSYNGLTSAARINLYQEYIDFVNYMGKIEYFADYEVNDLLRIARNLAYTFQISDFLKFD